jgi:pyruvate dehydrogenase E1 component alpha subunit
MTCTYRGHGAVIAMVAPLDRCFGAILGRAGGLCGGRGGSMHLADVSVGALGSNAIVGAQPISEQAIVGAALGPRSPVYARLPTSCSQTSPECASTRS